MHNPSLTQTPRYEPAGVIPLEHQPSLLEWLAAEDRIIYREKDEKSPLDAEDNNDLLDEELDDSFEKDDDD